MPPTTSLTHLPRRALAKRGLATNGLGRSEVALLVVAPQQHRGHDAVDSAFIQAGSRLHSTAAPTSNSLITTGNASATATITAQQAAQQQQQQQPHNRSLHSSTPHSRPTIANPSVLPLSDSFAAASAPAGAHSSMASPRIPLSALPTGHIVRSLMTTTISSSPTLLPPSLMFMSVLANATSPLLNPDRNPLVKWGLKTTFYRQFCAGENSVEVAHTAKQLRSLGFSGIILNYAREIVLPKEAKSNALERVSPEEHARCIAEEVIPWATGQMETVRLAQEGDFVAVKFSGAGRLALAALARREQPPAELAAALDAICSFAASRRIRLMFDAEQFSLQRGIDDWVLQMMRRYNTNLETPIIYNTYQCYLKSTPETISEHLALAQKEGFTLGAKLVRGAYMGMDSRELMWDTKTETDICFDSIARTLLKREWDSDITGSGEFPNVGICLATHNAQSVRLAQKISESGTKTDVSIAQLQGMADEVSCELLTTGEDATAQKAKAFKYLTWGTTGECMKYLLRRAQENKDAVQRTRDTRDAMRTELVRRVKGMFGFA
ncbi:Proline dehydrogenase [Zalerion maritima]|uniref:Proline dehydrogenase n=1 Tax=Zalerion maritima TaxID=339359 RepID=A0AAD5WQW3_9PEZI|nr:Proline dehydrogenase [Zalerion maritima]